MDKKQNLKEKISLDPDFINSPKYDNSLSKIIDAYPYGTTDTIIKRVLCLTQEELDTLNDSILRKLKNVVGEGYESGEN